MGKRAELIRRFWEVETNYRGRMATWMQLRIIQRVPRRLMWGYCFGFFLLAGLGETWLLVRALKGGAGAPVVIRARPVVGREVKRRVQVDVPLRTMLDSVERSPDLKRAWDSLLRVRPGLADTVREFRRMDSAGLDR